MTQLLAEIAGVIFAAVFVGTIESRYYDGATGTPYYTIVDAADNRIGGCTVILPPWFNRMGEFEPYRVGDLVKVTLINGRGYIDGLVQGGTYFNQEAELHVEGSWMELSPLRAVLGHSPNTVSIDEDGIRAKTDGPPLLRLDTSTVDGEVELRGKKVRLRINGEHLHLDDPERTDGAILRVLGYVPEWDGNPPPDSGNTAATAAEVRAVEPNTLNLYSRQYYAAPPGDDGDGEFEAGLVAGDDGDAAFNSEGPSAGNTEIASLHSHGMPHTHPVVAHHHTVHDHYHLSQSPFMVLADKVTIAQDLATQDTIPIGLADIPDDMKQMPDPFSFTYRQSSGAGLVDSWTVNWLSFPNWPMDSDPQYEMEVFAHKFSGSVVDQFISNGQPVNVNQYLLSEHSFGGTNIAYGRAIRSPFVSAIDDDTLRLGEITDASVQSTEGALAELIGVSGWYRIDETYAISVGVGSGSIAGLGSGVVTDQSQAAIGSISAVSVAQVNWGAIRVRSVDASGNYLPSDWSDMVAAYGVHLKPGFEYRTK